MKKNRALWIILGLISVMIFVYFYKFQKSENVFNWNESYSANSKDPYGSYVLYTLLQNHFPESTFQTINSPVANSLSIPLEKKNNYIFIGQEPYYRDNDMDSILSFVNKGNQAFIIANYLPIELLNQTILEYCGYYRDYYDSTVSISIKPFSENSSFSYDFDYIQNWKKEVYDWPYLDSLYCKDLKVLGHINDSLPNFLMVQHGKGRFFFHTSPIAFTNFNLLDSTKLLYAEKVFSHFQEGNIHWDTYSNIPYTDYAGNLTSPLQFILSQPSLKWAWYITLIMVILYMTIYTKRRQRVIPVLPPNVNSSIEFAETMGRLYFQQYGHIKLLKHKISLFNAHIRNQYHLPTTEINTEFVKKLSLRSGISKIDINNLYAEAKRLDFKADISDKELIKFHQLLESFYKNSK